MAAAPAEPRTVYAALGDSISIDDYAGWPGRGGASLLARNRDDDFPQWRGRDLASGGDPVPPARRRRRDLPHGAGVAAAPAHRARRRAGQPHARPADRDLWYCNVIEPNAWGAGEVRAAFWDALQPA